MRRCTGIFSRGSTCIGVALGSRPRCPFVRRLTTFRITGSASAAANCSRAGFRGGNLGWVDRRDWELYAGLYRKPLERFSDRQRAVLELLEREGPLNIQLIKEATGMLVKEITPVLHRLQEAFLVYEDQYDGEWDRSWYRFEEMFPETDPGTG